MRNLILLLSLCVLSVSAASTNRLGYVVMSDGTKAYPSNSVATPAQVNAISVELAPLADSAAADHTLATNADVLARAAYDDVRFISSPNIVSSTAYIQSVGAQASAGTNQIIRIHSLRPDGSPVTNLYLVATFDKLQTVSPAVDFRYVFTQGGTNTVWASATTAVCSWPTLISDPTVTNSTYIYSFNVPVPGVASCFFRVLSHDDGGSGSGYYFLVYNFITVNGRNGLTADIEGVGHYEGGILAALLEGQ